LTWPQRALAMPPAPPGSTHFPYTTLFRSMAANPNGLYRIKQSVDDTVNMELDFESFSFAQTRYINTLIDYQYLDARGQRIQKLFREPYNRLDIYGELHNDGKVEVLEGQSYLVEIELSDFAGNSTILRIPVEGKREAP